MPSQHILPLELQVPALAALVAFFAWVLRLIRRQRLSLRDSLLWLLSTAAALVVTAFPTLLVKTASLLGFQVPANALFAAGFLYLALNVLAVTLAASANSERVRRLAQECALLRAELDGLRAEQQAAGRAPPTAPNPDPERTRR
ncbi:MAG: DUF2304 domain-containing protein [Anaeromyxobacteraceae bacterium]